jgi:hypothetical protein
LRKREIVAPLLPSGRIRVRVEGLVHELLPTKRFVGWGRFRPVDERRAEPLGEALPWQREAYLALFPSLRMILLWPDERRRRAGIWWGLPFNASDARQRFRLSAEPAPVLLCDAALGAERFEQALVRVDGDALWFDGVDPRADPQAAAWLRDVATRDEPPAEWRGGLTDMQRRALAFAGVHEAATAQTDLERRLRRALAKADAVLHSFVETSESDGSRGAVIVEWSPREDAGRPGDSPLRYRSRLEADLTVVSSGICLAGRDRDFDLTSLVSVMQDAGHGIYPYDDA